MRLRVLVGVFLAWALLLNVGTATAFPLPQAVVGVYVETVILPAYSGKIFTAAERLTVECPRMFAKETMQQFTCEQFMAYVKKAQITTTFMIGGTAEYVFVSTEYAPDRNSALVLVQLTRRNRQGRVERQWTQTFTTVREDWWRIRLDDQIVAAVKKG